MSYPHGKVISISTAAAGETPSSVQAIVEVSEQIACQRCAAGKGCGAGLLGRRSGERRVVANIVPGLAVRQGDQVSLSMVSGSLLRAALLVYGYPLVAAVLAAAIAFGLRVGDLGAALAALFGLVAGLVVANRRLKASRCQRSFTPTIVAIKP